MRSNRILHGIAVGWGLGFAGEPVNGVLVCWFDGTKYEASHPDPVPYGAPVFVPYAPSDIATAAASLFKVRSHWSIPPVLPGVTTTVRVSWVENGTTQWRDGEGKALRLAALRAFRKAWGVADDASL